MGNRAWPHGTREAGMATGPRQMTPGWLGLQQGWPSGTRVAVMVKSLATWYHGGWDGNRV